MADQKVVENSEAGNGSQVVVKPVCTKKWKSYCVVYLLRILTLFATVSATVVMSIDKQTINTVVATIGNTPIRASVTAKFQHTPAFVFFVIANAMASFHNLLMLIVEFTGHKFDFKGLRHLLVPILDMLNVALISAGAGAAVFMGELGRNGNSHARWNKICDKFDTYCNHASGAIIASLAGLILMIIINVVSIAKLRNVQKSADSSMLP
ncbi:OLC1v1023131C1 [Oldenlandia corymbosa var. corymbosa]|uniref:CASP-like protein n=1 Tax=Oldenlandia corymbosa var. corymbosa TaxID=529605 RepID=A0AAV1C453_OLDCO|nr:OLC1v1023131C1 [Oldenlandia corymbosa var. corymbosa]